MSNEQYFVIYDNENGEITVSVIASKEILEKRINDEYWGKVHYRFLDSKTEFGYEYDAPAVYIIKGQSFVPRVETMVTRFIVD